MENRVQNIFSAIVVIRDGELLSEVTHRLTNHAKVSHHYYFLLFRILSVKNALIHFLDLKINLGLYITEISYK